MRTLIAAAMLVLQFTLAAQAAACSLPRPTAAIVLTIDGVIRDCNSEFEARLDLQMLEALPRKVIRTENPWEQGLVTYEGVLLRDLLDFVKANGTSLSIAALNDYRSEVSVEDARSHAIVLAYKRNGDYMSVREKGPLFVVFPFTDYPSLAVESRFAQSVWQVARITVK